MSKPKPSSASVRFDYHSAYNEIVNPKHFVSSSLYYVKHWLKPLGANGHMIVTVLRSHGYFDPDGGKHRDAIDVDQKTLAAECGLSLSTFQREFVKNVPLAKFVQREFVAVRDKAGRILREHYIYRVKMDDPLTPADQARFEQMSAGPDKQAAPTPIRQYDTSEVAPMMQNDIWALQTDAPISQNDLPTRQNDTLLKENPTLNTLNTSATPVAPGVALTLFPEKTAPTLAQLTEAKQRPYQQQAEQELIALFGFKEWKTLGDRARERQIKSRAESIYNTVQKGTAP